MMHASKPRSGHQLLKLIGDGCAPIHQAAQKCPNRWVHHLVAAPFCPNRWVHDGPIQCVMHHQGATSWNDGPIMGGHHPMAAPKGGLTLVQGVPALKGCLTLVHDGPSTTKKEVSLH